MSRLDYIFAPVKQLRGRITVVGDKSISHRAVLLGSLASGKTVIHNCLLAEDILNLIAVIQQLGITIEYTQSEVIVHGKGKHGYQIPSGPLNFGNSGTGMRLMAAVLAAQGLPAKLVGDESLSKRPMARIITPLTMMGAKIEASNENTPPLIIHPTAVNKAINYSLPIASAQVKSAIMLAALYAPGLSAITEPLPSRDHTERMLPCFGINVFRQENTVTLMGKKDLQATTIFVPADLSAAAFFMVAGCISSDAELTLIKVGINPTRLGIIHLLRRMGALIYIKNITWFNNEPVADITVKSSKLTGIVIDAFDVSLTIDELPILCIAAACAKGKTIITQAQELRYKESDRIKYMVRGLIELGINAQELSDGMVIEGGTIQGGEIDSGNDHRIAMAFCMAAAVSKQPIKVLNCANIATSLPNFIQLAEQIGFKIYISRVTK